jgi:hypothetical protein
MRGDRVAELFDAEQMGATAQWCAILCTQASKGRLLRPKVGGPSGALTSRDGRAIDMIRE